MRIFLALAFNEVSQGRGNRCYLWRQAYGSVWRLPEEPSPLAAPLCMSGYLKGGLGAWEAWEARTGKDMDDLGAKGGCVGRIGRVTTFPQGALATGENLDQDSRDFLDHGVVGEDMPWARPVLRMGELAFSKFRLFYQGETCPELEPIPKTPGLTKLLFNVKIGSGDTSCPDIVSHTRNTKDYAFVCFSGMFDYLISSYLT